jgi:5'-nucleotidase
LYATFAGADFQFLAANVAYKDTGETIFPPYRIEKFNGVKVAIIGMTLEGTPQIVTPAGISHVNFFDEADSVNALVPELQEQDVETFIVLLHEGGSVSDPLNENTINSCTNPTGPLPPIVERMDEAIDVVVTGHTNWAVNCDIDGKIVTGAAAFGRLVTDIDLTVSRATKDVVSATVNNKIVTRTVPTTPALTTLVDKYRTLSAPLANRVIGSTTAPILRANNAAGESALGDVIADAQLAATAPANLGGAQLALMNPGGIRADFDAGPVTYGEAFAVQPFGNSLVTMTLTGAELDAVLEQQFSFARATILQVSAGFTYTWSGSAPVGSKVSNIMLNGTPIDPATEYRVTVNNFLATGGDGFSTLTVGRNQLGGDVDLDALVKYFEANSPVAPGPQDRITTVP